VFYATDRDITGEESPAEFYGSERGSVSYGTCDVSIPKRHQTGELERPSIWRFEFRPDPRKHVVLLDLQMFEDADAYFEKLSATIAEDRRNTFVFVHGYNVSFEDAALRTAQVAFDLQFQGVPIFYSWPSQGTFEGYTVDETNIQWTIPHLEAFLRDVARRTDADNIYLIAHSIGNRALIRAATNAAIQDEQLRKKLKEVILAAPDIDADVFKDQLAPKLAAAIAAPITLYASSDDTALKASKEVHGYARAGDAGEGLVLLGDVETIDASGVEADFLGHSYYAETGLVLSDLGALVGRGDRADQRDLLEPMTRNGKTYWRFRSAAPPSVD